MAIARVVKVVDDYTVVINVGSENGVSYADKFLIYGLDGEIVDIDTGENLGQLEVVRGRGKVVHVQPRLATLSSYEVLHRPGVKKIIKREAKGIMAAYALGGPSTEEIEEGPTTQIVPLSATEVGDYAKPI